MSMYLAQVYKQKYHLNSSEDAITEQFYKKGISMKLKRFSVALLMLFCVFSVVQAQKLGRTVRKEITINGEKISKRMKYDTLKEYNPDGKLIHSNSLKYGEEWHEYDLNGNKIHSKYSNGSEIWYEYDSKGNKIYTKYLPENKHRNIQEKWFEYVL